MADATGNFLDGVQVFSLNEMIGVLFQEEVSRILQRTGNRSSERNYVLYVVRFSVQFGKKFFVNRNFKGKSGELSSITKR